MRRSQRASTIKKSQELESKLASRVRKSRARKSLKHLPAAENIELSSTTGEFETSAKDTSGEDTVFSEEDEYWVDTSACSLTDFELVSPASPFPPPPTASDRWSTSVNRFGLENTEAEGAEVAPSYGSFPLLSPAIPNKDSTVDIVNTIKNEYIELSPSVSPNSSLTTIKENTMDEREYNLFYTEIDDKSVNIETLIAMFNEDTVTLLDINTYNDELKNIFAAFTMFETKYLDLRGKLDRENDADVLRLTALKEIHERMKKKVVDNSVKVKKKLLELQSDESSSSARASDTIAKDKLKLKVRHAVNKF